MLDGKTHGLMDAEFAARCYSPEIVDVEAGQTTACVDGSNGEIAIRCDVSCVAIDITSSSN